MSSFHYEPSDAFRYIEKNVLFGMVISSNICLVLLFIMLILFVYKVKLIKEFDKWMKIDTIIHFIGNIIFCAGAAFFRCDLIFPIQYNITNTLHPNHSICRICVSIPYIGYYISKIFLYLLFIRRIESTFNGSVHECNKAFIHTFQFIVISTLIGSMAVFLLSQSYQYCATEDDSIHICSVYTQNPIENIGGLAIIIMSIFDLLYSTLTLIFFIYKLKKLIQSQLQITCTEVCNHHSEDGVSYLKLTDDESENKKNIVRFQGQERLNQLLSVSLKSCVLCFVTVASNWLFVFVGLTFVFDLGWFICLDRLINAICVYLLYQFNDRLYHKICCPFIILWKCIAKCFGFTDNKMYQKQMRMTLTESQSRSRKGRTLQLSHM